MSTTIAAIVAQIAACRTNTSRSPAELQVDPPIYERLKEELAACHRIANWKDGEGNPQVDHPQYPGANGGYTKLRVDGVLITPLDPSLAEAP